MTEAVRPATPLERSDLALLGGLAALKVLIHLPVLHRYGYHHDELYFIACGQHPSFGYVDHAPLVVPGIRDARADAGSAGRTGRVHRRATADQPGPQQPPGVDLQQRS